MGKKWSALGAFLGFLAVAIGAFGAHGLTGRISEKSLSVYHTGAQYQMYHALALIVLGLWLDRFQTKVLKIAAWSFLIGIILFSGSLYALALTEIRPLGMITPFGGLAFLLGWLLFAASLLKTRDL